MTFQSRVHTSMVHPAVEMLITLFVTSFFPIYISSLIVGDTAFVGYIFVAGATGDLEAAVVVGVDVVARVVAYVVAVVIQFLAFLLQEIKHKEY